MATRGGTFSYKLFVANLPWTVASRQLREYFSQFGYILHANVVFDKNSGMSRQFGFVTFENKTSFDAARNKATHMLEGHTLSIDVVAVPSNKVE